MKLYNLIFGTLLFAASATAAPIASDTFYYPHGTVLADGIANGGAGWNAGWDKATGVGLTVSGAQVVQYSNSESTRELANPFALEGGGAYYFAFLARADASGTFAFQMRTSLNQVRWAFTKNADDSFTVQGGLTTATSAPGLFAGGREYLVVSKFNTSGDIAYVKLFDTSDPGDYTTEPTTWDLSASGLTGVTIDWLDLDVNAGTVTLDDVRIATTYAEVIPTLKPYSTFVYEVEQPVTTDTNEWTYTVDEDGDYQIGMAWVETQSGGDVTIEIFKNGLERIMALYAPAGEVTRFETRIENLRQSDEITVRLTPDGSTYRAGYRIAFGTPTFDGLPVFDVAGYGAVGDGVTDDMAAIRAAVTDARHAGGGIVRLDGTKTYRSIGLADQTVESLFDLYGARDIKIEGNGADIVLHPPDKLAWVESSDNIQIDGLTVDYDPKPYYQGTIDAIDVGGLTADITVPARYEEPVVGTNTIPSHAPFFAFTFIPNEPGSRAGWDGKHFYIESTETIGGDPRKIRLHGDADTTMTHPAVALQHALDNSATEIIVPHRDYGHRGGFSLQVGSSSRVTMSNIRFYMMPHLGVLPGKNTGPVAFSNVDLTMSDPATELYWSWRGAYSVTGHNRWGFLIEDGEWHGAAMYDDVLAFFMRRQDVLSINAQTLNLELGEYADLFRVGDWVSIWSEGQTTLRGMSRITDVTKEHGDGTFDITLESLPAGTVTNDCVINEELFNRDTVVRNCINYPEGASPATTRIRTGGHFLDCSFNGLYFKTEYEEVFNPVRCRNLLLENTVIGPSRWDRIRFDAALNPRMVGCTLEDTYVLGDQGAEGIVLDGNTWTNMPGDIIDLDDDSHAWLFGNTTRNGSAAGLSSHVSVDGTSSITYAKPGDYPDPVPAGPSDYSHLLVPEADSYVQDGTPTDNYGTLTALLCKDDVGGTFTRQPYLRFNLSDVRGTVQSAVLRLRVAGTDGSGDTHTTFFVSDDSWGETSITWNNRPVPGTTLTSAAPGGVGDWIEFDVTDQVATESAGDGLFSAAIISDGTVLVEYGSRESGSNAPQLVVQTSWSYGAWSNQYQLVLGPDGDDDLDGISNIDEYARGGNPTNDLDTGYAPEYVFMDLAGTNWFAYVHPERTASDSGLRYTAESTDNLVSNSWVPVAAVDVDVNALEPGLDLVTNRIPTEGKTQQFIRLKVEEK
jgi:hypothetical protein